jgi:hypothetical protein
MSVASISSSTTGYQSGGQQNIVQYLQTLSQALQSGNRSNAQQAYNTLLQSLPRQNPAASANKQASQFQQGLASIGNALKAGDISGAQAAMQTLQRDVKVHSNHIARVQGPGSAPATPTTKTPSDQMPDSTTSDAPAPVIVTGPVRAVGLVA